MGLHGTLHVGRRLLVPLATMPRWLAAVLLLTIGLPVLALFALVALAAAMLVFVFAIVSTLLAAARNLLAGPVRSVPNEGRRNVRVAVGPRQDVFVN
jgi:hypothetical protein